MRYTLGVSALDSSVVLLLLSLSFDATGWCTNLGNTPVSGSYGLYSLNVEASYFLMTSTVPIPIDKQPLVLILLIYANDPLW